MVACFASRVDVFWMFLIHEGSRVLVAEWERALCVCVCVRERERERERIDDGASRRDFVSWLEWVGVWLRL